MCALFVLGLYYLAYYPGVFNDDSIDQLYQAQSNNYNDWHPVFQTLIALKIPLLLSGNHIQAIVPFQILLLALVFAYSCESIRKLTNIFYAYIVLCFILFNLNTVQIIVHPWKDVTFAMGSLLLITFSANIYFSRGQWIKIPVNIVATIIAFTVTTIVRHNAILFTLPLLIAVCLAISFKRTLILLAGVVMLYVGIKVPLYSFLNVSKPDQRQVETLGLPLSIIGSVVSFDPESLDSGTLEYAYSIIPKEVWENEYVNGNFNSVKYNMKTNLYAVEERGTAEALDMLIKSFRASPKIAMKSLIKCTAPAYTITDNDSYYIKSRNNYVEHTGIGFLKSCFEKYNVFTNNLLPHLFMYSGSMLLIIIICILSKCRLNSLKDWKRILFAIPVFT